MSFMIIAPATVPANSAGTAVSLSSNDVNMSYSGPDNQNETGIPASTISPTMFLRFVMLGPIPADLTKLPTLLITVGTGATVEVTAADTYPANAIGLYDGVNQSEAAAANWFNASATNVYVVKVFVFIPGSAYKIAVKNNDIVPRDFTLVVAGSLSDSQQPWLDATTTLSFDMLVGLSLAQSITLNNKGTGPVTVIAVTPALSAGFSLVSALPVTVPPNPLPAASLTINFTAPAAPPPPNGTTSVTAVLSSGDLGAGTLAGHNNTVALSAVTRGLEVVLLLDDSGSMLLAPDASAAAGTTQSRWSELASASKLFLELLGGFGMGAGTFGIVRFPGTNPADVTTFDVQPPIAIPAATGMAAAKSLIDAIAPTDSTPMGDGIGRTINAAYPYFSTYSPGGTPAQQVNRRWLIVFSDGANNSGALQPRSFISSPYGGTATPGTSLADRQIAVYSVAYGLAGAGQVDYQLMKDLASGSLNHGMYTQVDTAPGASATAMDLANSLKNAILSGIVPVYAPADPRGALLPGGVAKYAVPITPYDQRAAFVLTWDYPSPRLFTLALITPLGETISSTTQLPGVSFSVEQRYAVFQIEQAFLTNTVDPTKPRFGNWTVVVTRLQLDDTLSSILPAASQRVPLAYEYSALVRSRLRLDVTFDSPTYYAGDPIGLRASLVLDGAPLTGIQVAAEVDSPNQAADNFLAGAAVTDAQYQAMKAKLGNQDANPIYIKGLAAQANGLFFQAASHSAVIPLSDPKQLGIYSGTVAQTTTADTYRFVVAAVGQTPDGFSFRRERHVQIRVGVKPDAASTLIDLQFQPVSGTNATAIVRAIPRDRFGNVVLIDPSIKGSLTLTTTAGAFTTPITTSFDGSYSQTLTYPVGSTPSVGLVIWGRPVVSGVSVPPVGALFWADRVVSFHAGGQAVPGANQHTDPNAALGDAVTKGSFLFVSLGAFGTLELGVYGKEILADGPDDVVVVVQPDSDLRPFLVEVEPVNKPGHWVALGTSPGVTRGFSLKAAAVRSVSAVRITDKSGRTRDGSLKPSPTPGVSIRGVGFRKTGIEDGSTECSECIEKLCDLLRKICP